MAAGVEVGGEYGGEGDNDEEEEIQNSFFGLVWTFLDYFKKSPFGGIWSWVHVLAQPA